MDSDLVRVAVVQDCPVVFDKQATIEKVATLARAAKEGGADLIVFPEAFVSAYPKGLGFGAVVGVRTPEGRDDFRRYFESGLDVPGPDTKKIGAIAKALAVTLVIGVIERELGTLHCTVLFFGPDGSLMGKHRKLMPTAAERLVWGYGDGSTLPVFDTPMGRLGAVICWENYMPMLRMAMYAKGIEIYCAPTADDRPTWLPTLRHIAMEGRCFVIGACQILNRGDCPEDYAAVQGNAPETALMRGGSCIIGPLGEVLAEPVFDDRTILHATLDRRALARSKMDFDVAGNYARPDVFHLTVNEAPTPAVTFTGTATDPAGPSKA